MPRMRDLGTDETHKYFIQKRTKVALETVQTQTQSNKTSNASPASFCSNAEW